MTVAYWVIAGLLAVLFLAAGLLSLARPREALAGMGLAWTADYTAGQVKAIGAAEVLGAIGLILPKLLHVAAVLGPIAAICLTVLMAGAVSVHRRRSEPFVPQLLLAVLALAAAILGVVSIA